MKKADQSNLRPSLFFVGPMVGSRAGCVTTQGLILSRLFKSQGYEVVVASSLQNSYLRLADIILALIKNRSSIEVVILEVYGGRSFVVEDAASWLASRFGLPIVMWLHGGGLGEFMGRFPRWSRRVLGRAPILVTPSEFLARATSACYEQMRISGARSPECDRSA